MLPSLVVIVLMVRVPLRLVVVSEQPQQKQEHAEPHQLSVGCFHGDFSCRLPSSKAMLLHRRAGPLASAEFGPTPGPPYPVRIAQHEAGAVGRRLWSSMCASQSAQTHQFFESYVRFVDLVNEPALDGGPREDAHESAPSSA